MAIELTKQEVEQILPSVKRYILEEFDEEITDLKAQLLLNYFMKEIGPYAYNKGVKDAEYFIRNRLDDVQASCYEFELTYWDKKKK
ncbi:MAG: DUF2164 domain-containing protein [Opitutales bacterium]|nr:DUF2164 domain-containing protein [Opitutales bacterium]